MKPGQRFATHQKQTAEFSPELLGSGTTLRLGLGPECLVLALSIARFF
jgi:hypothetical protein